MPHESDFQSLIAAARLGEEWAWTQMYREYSPAVLRYLKGHGATEPEDLLGEVFVQLVRNIGSFEGTESEFRSWVFMVARNRLVDEWRRAGRYRADAAEHETLVALTGSGDAEEDALRRLSDQRVLAILGKLTRDQRDVIFLRYFARLTVEEAAGVMGKRPGAVKMLQSRALGAIQRLMAKEGVTL